MAKERATRDVISYEDNLTEEECEEKQEHEGKSFLSDGEKLCTSESIKLYSGLKPQSARVLWQDPQEFAIQYRESELVTGEDDAYRYVKIFKDLSRLKRFNSEEAIEYELIIVRPPRIKDDAPFQDET
uniref:Uncharacterized protein n=1 Tax=Brassica oleracea var. oleracea TaxID=109376 RepID=A0A0D3C394_BRAOL